MARAKTQQRVEQTDDGVSNAPAQQESSSVAANDIARRAYERYLARGCEPGRDLDDWLDAERELQHIADPATT